MTKPNIIFVFSDQQHYDSFDPESSSLRLPGIRRLAAEGVRFPNAYATNPVCGPARSSMFTGRMPSELGTDFNGTDFQVPVELISERLQTVGYRNYYAGKWHVGHCMMYDIPGFEVLCTANNCNGNFSDPAITATVEGFLRNYDEDEPFFLTVSWQQPHDICGWKSFQDARREELPYPWLEDEFPPAPGNLREFDDDEPKALQNFRRNIPSGKNDWDDTAWQFYRWAYDRQIEMVDAELDRLLTVLDETGQRDNTIIIYTTDHGDGAGNHALTDKTYLYEESARTPIIVSYPEKLEPGSTNETLASGLDIFPTICDAAGAEIPSTVHGRSLLRDDLDQREYICTESSHHAVARMIRSQRHKYVLYKETGDEQLFDLVADPLEQKNLAHVPCHTNTVAQHRSWLEEWEDGLDVLAGSEFFSGDVHFPVLVRGGAESLAELGDEVFIVVESNLPRDILDFVVSGLEQLRRSFQTNLPQNLRRELVEVALECVGQAGLRNRGFRYDIADRDAVDVVLPHVVDRFANMR